MIDAERLIGARNFTSNQERMTVHMKKMTLNLKLFVGGFSLVLIPLMVVGFFSIIKASDALEEASKREMLVMCQDTAYTAQLSLSGEMEKWLGFWPSAIPLSMGPRWLPNQGGVIQGDCKAFPEAVHCHEADRRGLRNHLRPRGERDIFAGRLRWLLFRRQHCRQEYF
jgi:hypothetical protein